MSVEEAIKDAKWYVIHTYSGYETMVKDSLEKLIDNNNLQENIFEIQIPTEETLEENSKGKKKIVERKKFPCYVFLKMIYSNDIWYLVTNTRGVTGFVGPQGRPLPLTDEEVARNGLEHPKNMTVDFVIGDTVQVVSGPLESFSGKVVTINESTQKVSVKVEMFGRSTDVELDFVQVKKLGGAEVKAEVKQEAKQDVKPTQSNNEKESEEVKENTDTVENTEIKSDSATEGNTEENKE